MSGLVVESSDVAVSFSIWDSVVLVQVGTGCSRSHAPYSSDHNSLTTTDFDKKFKCKTKWTMGKRMSMVQKIDILSIIIDR